MAQVPLISLNDGNSIPQLGLGVWQVEPGITALHARNPTGPSPVAPKPRLETPRLESLIFYVV